MGRIADGRRWLLAPPDQGWSRVEAREIARLLQEEGIVAHPVDRSDTRFHPVEVEDGRSAMRAKLLLDDLGVVVDLKGTPEPDTRA